MKACGRQRSGSTRVLSNILTLTLLTLVVKTLRHALNDLIDAAPDWLAARLDPAWGDRSAVRVEGERLPEDATLCRLLVETAGQEAPARLNAPGECDAPAELLLRPAIQTLCTVSLQHMVCTTCADAAPQTIVPRPTPHLAV